jgi:hypothetical protein
MSAWFLAVIVQVTAPGPDVNALVSRLGSKDPAERAAAATALEAHGEQALPALRAALGVQDLEVRRRAAGLIRKIEADQLIRPTLVSLDFNGRPASEVIQELGARTGCPIRIHEVRKDWLAEKITLHEPRPIPFWKAIDKLCEAGRFQYNLNLGSISLFRDETSGPACDFGAFRVQLEAIAYDHRYRQLHLSVPFVSDEDRAASCITLRVMVEPRMMIRNDGPLKGLSVIDDRGQSLLPANPESKQDVQEFGFTPGGYVLGQVPLGRVAQPGRAIRKLRGVAPVVVAKRRPDPLVIPLAGAEGRSFRSGESVLTIRTLRKHTPAMKVTIEPVGPDGKPNAPGRAGQATEIVLTLRPAGPAGAQIGHSRVSEDQFEVVDGRGRVWKPLPWWLSDSGPRPDGTELRVRLTPVDENLAPWPGDLVGARLRYHETAVVKVDVPFEFADVALP